ncbi:tryptophan synthase subunit beta [Helicobacter muridarum]|uniref:Tryptophan synthase beta chain n=1 Tax=Helicobacter muridarum TaxID=216 RepID=A0A377PTY5_9HELI|nr:tryptophan synthase subunit beta [Helicobacter muridarum]TLE01096.1 tryptophan synthase subunit beta [Helicobacter muridarum]STQ85959.1 tryptophan synthase subunit beta [Helicobacter muridarum]
MQDELFSRSRGGYFGVGDLSFGGCFVPEILYPVIMDLQEAYSNIFKSKSFKKEYKSLLRNFVGRPTPLLYAKNASNILNNDIFLKFEGLANTGAHKINNAIAQVLLAKRMKKSLVIAETGAGQHGVAVASACASIGMPCKIFMGEVDMQRQRPNVFIMEQFGANVVPVSSGSKTLKDAVNETLREWSNDPHGTFYVLGSAVGPAPYPDMVRDAQSVIGKEIKKQLHRTLGILPDYLIACVGGGSNAMGAFTAFLENIDVNLVMVEAGGDNFLPKKHAMRLHSDSDARVGVVQGYKSYFLQDKNGQIVDTHSISAGLDYPGVGPQIAHLASINRIKCLAASDNEALEALQFFAKHEGILAALESSHALAGALKIAKNVSNKTIVVNVSGRGDKDIFITAKHLCAQKWKDFLELELSSVNENLKKQTRDSINPKKSMQVDNDVDKLVLNSADFNASNDDIVLDKAEPILPAMHINQPNIKQDVLDLNELSDEDFSFLDVCHSDLNNDSKLEESELSNPDLTQDVQNLQEHTQNAIVMEDITEGEKAKSNQKEIQSREDINDELVNEESIQDTHILNSTLNSQENAEVQIDQNKIQDELHILVTPKDTQSIALEYNFDSQASNSKHDMFDFLTLDKINLDSTETLESLSLCDELQVKDTNNSDNIELDRFDDNLLSLDYSADEDSGQSQSIDFLLNSQYQNTTQDLNKTNSNEKSTHSHQCISQEAQNECSNLDSKVKVLETDMGLSKIWGKSLKS